MDAFESWLAGRCSQKQVDPIIMLCTCITAVCSRLFPPVHPEGEPVTVDVDEPATPRNGWNTRAARHAAW